MIHISRLLGSTESAVIQQCYVAAKTKAFLCLNLRNHTHHLSFLCKLPAHTHTHTRTCTHCRHYPRSFTALLIFQQEEEELWEDKDLAKTHTQAHALQILLKTNIRPWLTCRARQIWLFLSFFLTLADSILKTCVDLSSFKAFSW